MSRIQECSKNSASWGVSQDGDTPLHKGRRRAARGWPRSACAWGWVQRRARLEAAAAADATSATAAAGLPQADTALSMSRN